MLGGRSVRRRRLLGLAVAVLGVLALVRVADEAPSPPARLAGVADELTGFWQDALPDEAVQPDVVLVEDERDTSCGATVEEEGSFYCGADDTVYLLQGDLDDLSGLAPGARRAAEVYLLAHEFGHVVQALLDVDEGDAGPGPDGDSVRYELQADCLAGAYVATRPEAAGERAAYLAAVRDAGDDAGEPLPEEEYEHGSSAQRTEAFTDGLDGGAGACGVAGLTPEQDEDQTLRPAA